MLQNDLDLFSPYNAPNELLVHFLKTHGVPVSTVPEANEPQLTLERLDDLGFLVTRDKLEKALKDLESASEITLDFEISYTTKFMNLIDKRIGKLQKHAVLTHLAKLSFDCTEEYKLDAEDFHPNQYRPQWLLGLYMNENFYIVSNVDVEDSFSIVENSKIFIKRFAQVFDQKLIIGQNLKFDIKLLSDLFEFSAHDILDYKVADLMMMAYILNTERKRYALSVLAKEFLPQTEDGRYFIIGKKRIPVSWKESEEFHRTLLIDRLEETAIYNYNDLVITEALYRVLKAKIEENNATAAFEVYKWFVPFYTALEYLGVKIDQEAADELLASKKKEAKFAAYEAGLLLEEVFKDLSKSEEFRKEFIKNAKVHVKNKTKKLQNVDDEEKILAQMKKTFSFFDPETFELKLNIDHMLKNTVREFIALNLQTMGLPVEKTPKGSLAFTKDTLNNLTNELKKIEELRKLDEAEKTFKKIMEKIITVNSAKANIARIAAFGTLANAIYDGRLHSEFKLTGTATGRISSIRPGVMNMPKMIKRLIISSLGKITQIDLASAEAKLYVNTIQHKKLIKQLLNGGDIYSLIGKEVLEIEISKKTRPIERNIMKVGILAKMYGQSSAGLSRVLQDYYEPILQEILPGLEKEDETPEETQKRLLEDAEKRKKYPFIYEWDMIDFENRTLHYQKLAEKIIDRFEEQLTSPAYEYWVVSHLFNYENPKESYVENQLGHRRYFDMSIESVFTGHLDTGGNPELDYALLYAFFKKFLLEGEKLPQTSYIYNKDTKDFSEKNAVLKKHFALYGISSALQKTYTKYKNYQEFQKRWFELLDLWKEKREEIGLPFYRFISCCFEEYAEETLGEIAEDFDKFTETNIKLKKKQLLPLNFFTFAVNLSKQAAPILHDPQKLYSLLQEGMERKVYWPLKHIFEVFKGEVANLDNTAVNINSALKRIALHEPSIQRLAKGIQVIAARYREALNFPMQGVSSFINTNFVYTTWKRCLEQALNINVVITIHDAGIYEHTIEDIPKFSEIAESTYSDPKVIMPMLEKSLKKLHNTDKIILAPIGGELEIADNLGQTK